MQAVCFKPGEEKKGRNADNGRLENPKKIPNKIQKI
jgi:hypothetical protein